MCYVSYNLETKVFNHFILNHIHTYKIEMCFQCFTVLYLDGIGRGSRLHDQLFTLKGGGGRIPTP